MNEIITVDGEKYTATNVITGLNSISFMLPDLTEDEVKVVFKNAKSLTVGNGKTVYGDYPRVEFDSLTINAADEISVTMHIVDKMKSNY